jgi:hypothetical protein
VSKLPNMKFHDTRRTATRLKVMAQVHLSPDINRHQNSPRMTKFLHPRALAVVLGGSVLSSAVWACSGVGPAGKPVVFGDQTNIVIWDEAHHTEHFIRNANFRSGADDFGFIAPTPGKPELHEASNQAFYTLASLAPVPRYNLAGAAGGGGFGGGSRSAEVKVIQEADVAGFHATTVFSKSAQAINDWMNEHGYVSTPEVEKWAERYCSRGWYLTAFKVVDKTKLAASTGTVRMTFHTNKPFNPFYVPTTNILTTKKGTLRVYFVSVGNYDAKIGRSEIWQTPQWTAQIPEASSALLAKQVKILAEDIPDNSQVETFVDNDFPRPAADDIYFTKSRPVRSLRPVPTRVIPPFAVAPVFAGLGLLVVGRRRRKVD